ncbi:MAG: formylglycine-generating enzyme family protein, partial [Planctomycetales bacterium]
LRDRVAQAPPDQFSLIETFCRRLINSPKDNDLQTRGFAAEILMRLGIQTPQTRGPALIVEEKSGMTFVRVPKGEFLMGSERGDADEKLVHKVLISQPFVLGKYQVTNAQYARFLESADGNTRKPAYWDDRRFNQPEQPVVGVSWNEAMAFAKWAGGRLPTEAEWEYACRAGTTTEYSFGDDEGGLSQYSWFDENSGDQTQPVGSKKPNAWDLYDMHGNVWEWCLDWWGVYSADVVDDPRGPEKGQYRVNRGGSWFADASDCRSAVRNGSRPNYRDYYLGFRVVLSSVR